MIFELNTNIISFNDEFVQPIKGHFVFEDGMACLIVGEAIWLESIPKMVLSLAVDGGYQLAVVGEEVVFFGTKADIIGEAFISYSSDIVP